MNNIVRKILKESKDGLNFKNIKKLVSSEVDNLDKNELKGVLEQLETDGKITKHEDIWMFAKVKKASNDNAIDKKVKKRKIDASLNAKSDDDQVEDASDSKLSKIPKNISKDSDIEVTNDESNIDFTLQSSKSTYYDELWKNGEKYYKDGTLPIDYQRKNPDGITRLFCGNLNKKVTEEQLKQCIEGITYIKWITDKQTKEFYGSTFLEMRDSQAAITAVMQDGTKFLGRPLKIYFCPPKPGDIWPPIHQTSREQTGVSKAFEKKPKTPKPIGCKKLFIGNLSYEIDDDLAVEFFKNCGELVGLRWLVNRDTGDFRGGGYIEFATTEEAEEAFKLDGALLLNRPIRIDWTE